MLLLPAGDAIAKHLGSVSPYGPEFLAWSRFAIGAIALLPIAIALGVFRSLSLLFYVQQAIRGALVAAAISLILRSLETTPLANAFGAYFIGPSLATLLAVLLLRERATRFEWFAVGIGFIGVLLVVQPSAEMHLGILWALLGGACYGGMLVATRWSAGNGPPFAQLVAQFSFGFVFLFPLGAAEIVTHGLHQFDWLVLMCACSLGANIFSILALRSAPAAYLAPVVYFQIVSASTLSVWVFDDAIDGLALVGLVVIVMAGLSRIPAARGFAANR